MRTRSIILGYVTLTLLLTAGAAQGLSGSNTVFTDDIVNGAVTTADIKGNAVSGSRVLDNSMTGADINESTLKIRRHFVARVKGPANIANTVLIDGDATSATSEIVGTYRVTFPVPVSACTATANAGNFAGAGGAFSNGAWAVTDAFDLNPNVVVVSITTVSAGSLNPIASSFVLDLSCPAP